MTDQTVTISPTWVAEKAKQVVDLIRVDIADGLYEPEPDAVTKLEGFMDLHDYVDANDYLIEVCYADAHQEEFDAVADLVDILLSEDPIIVR